MEVQTICVLVYLSILVLPTCSRQPRAYWVFVKV